jgi:nucleotide-binding universal stress UspA family protein
MKILVGYDGSEEAKEAVELARKHALTFSAKVYVVTSLPGESHTTAIDVLEREKDLDQVRKLFEESSTPVETHILVRGLNPGEDLVLFAKENEVDEIIVGVRKVSAVGKLLFGSNARYVILHAHCPVVTVK